MGNGERKREIGEALLFDYFPRNSTDASQMRRLATTTLHRPAPIANMNGEQVDGKYVRNVDY